VYLGSPSLHARAAEGFSVVPIPKLRFSTVRQPPLRWPKTAWYSEHEVGGSPFLESRVEDWKTKEEVETDKMTLIAQLRRAAWGKWTEDVPDESALHCWDRTGE
jgi:hypothetical protein